MTALTSFAQSSKNRAARTVILHLSPDLESSDPGRETVDLAVLTQRSGRRALIASAGGRLVTEAERAAVRHKRLPLDGQGLFSDWRCRLQLEAMIQKERPSLIHAHGIATLPYAYAASRLHHLPLVADLTQPLPETARIRRLINHLRHSPCIIRVPSEYMGRHLHEQFGVPVDRLSHVMPGVDLQWHGAGFISPERLQNLNNQWRLPEHASVVLMPMPLHPGFGHKQLLEALAQLKDENIFSILTGSDRHALGMRQEIEQQLEQLGLVGKVIMPEYCADLPAACWLAGVVIATNVAPRGQNLELLAAQAIGRPVIITDSGANHEMGMNGETAWLVPSGDIQALVNALREAVNLTTDQRLTIADRTHNFIAETFPQGAWFHGMMDIYDNLLRPEGYAAEARAA